MSNNKQIQKHLELPHQETIVGINTIQTKPFDYQKIEKMSNNKQSSVEWLVEQLEKHYVKTDLKNTVVYQQAKAMHKEESQKIFECGRNFQLTGEGTFEQVYNETFGGNNED